MIHNPLQKCNKNSHCLKHCELFFILDIFVREKYKKLKKILKIILKNFHFRNV